MLKRLLVAGLLLFVVSAQGWGATVALGAPSTGVECSPNERIDRETGQCILRLVVVQTDGGSERSSEGSQASSSTNSASAPVCGSAGQAVACRTSFGAWSSLAGAWCHVSPHQNQDLVSADDGHTELTVYVCTPPGSDLNPDPSRTFNRWLPGPPEAVEVDPREVAERILARLDLEAIDLGMFPAGDTETRMDFVGWNAWLWAESPTQRQWGPITSSDSASGITVTLNAVVDRVAWDMGDGTTLRCGKGTPWTEARTRGGKNIPSPDCGHVYEQMGTYTVTATSRWTVTWSGAGQSGTIPFSLSRSTDYLVGEFQTVNN